MKTGFKKFGLAVAASAIVVASPSAAIAQTAKIAVSLPPQSLDTALKALSSMSGVDILFSPSLVGQRKSRAVRGTMSTKEAARLLVRNYPIEVVENGSGGLVLRASPSSNDRPGRTSSTGDAPGSEAGATIAFGQGERLLDEDIIVTGRQPIFKADVVQVGAFRNQSILDTPATVSVMSRALLDAQGAIGLEEALRNTPGITQQTTSPTTSNNFVSRGVALNPRTNYRLNGALQIVNLSPIPIENKQRVELLKGVSAIYYGLASPSGIVNIVTKRAGDKPVTSIYANGDVEGSYGGGIDVGRKFGTEGQFGVRLNGYASHVETPINGVNGYRYMASGAFDWQATDKLSFKLDVEHYRRSTDEPGAIALAAARLLTEIPNPHRRYAPSNMPFRTWTTNILGRIDYSIADAWTVRAEAGIANSRRQRSRADFAFTSTATGPTTGIGRLALSTTPDQLYRNEYVRAELAGKANTFGIEHELLVGASRNRQIHDAEHVQNFANVPQNLYNPVDTPFSSLVPTTTRLVASNLNVDTGLYAMDIARIGEKLILIGGIRRVIYGTDDASGDFTLRAWTPTAGVVFRPTPKTSLYFSYIEGLESAGTAGLGTANEGEALPAVRSKQIEFGGRLEFLGALASIAYFKIDRGLNYVNGQNREVADGRAIHEGVEGSLQGNLTPELSVVLTGQFLTAKQRETGVAAQNGLRVPHAPRWAGSAFAEYRPAFIPGAGVNAGAFYNGGRYSDALNTFLMRGYTTYSLGANYKHKLSDSQSIMFRVNGDNITNKRYWSSGGAVFYVGLARQVRFSATLDF